MESTSRTRRRREKTSSASSSSTCCCISELPEEVLLHIISFLPIKDAIATSFLSKTWRNLWTYSLSLIFDRWLVSPQLSCPHSSSAFVSLLAQAFQRYHHSNIRYLSISSHYHQTIGPHIDNWIYAAARNSNIQHLELLLGISREGRPPYNLSLSALASQSLTTLSLCGCCLFSSSANLLFRSLQFMFLAEVKLTDDIILHLIAGCPELEDLTLDECQGMDCLKISSSRLKNLSFSNCDFGYLEIDAPNLTSFDCSLQQGDCSFKDVSSLVAASVVLDPSYWYSFADEVPPFYPVCKVAAAFTPARRLTMQSRWRVA